jgi:hypothetical protein
MSHIDRGAGSGTCQSCRKSVQSGRLGTVRRHRLASGNYCPGGGCLSVEEAVPMSDGEARKLIDDMLRYAGGA